jgi:hypothetical protein
MSSLAASQANPDSYGVGCMLDGLPTNCNRVLRAINNGEASKLILYGSSPDVALANMGLFLVEHPLSPTRPTTPPQLRPYRPNPSPGNPAPFNTGCDELEWRYSLVGLYQPQTTYDPRVDSRLRGATLQKSITDCLKLALMVYKAGQVFGGANPFTDNGRAIIRGLMSGLTEYSAVRLGQLEESDRNYRVGVFKGGPQYGDPHFGGGFLDSGFASAFQDHSNQVRHVLPWRWLGYRRISIKAESV